MAIKRIEAHRPGYFVNLTKEDLDRKLKHLEEGILLIDELKDHLKDGDWDIMANFMYDLYLDIGRNQLFGTSELMYNYLYYSNQLAKAWFSYVYKPGKELRFKLGRNWFETKGRFHPRYIGVGWAAIGLKTSIILRDREGVDIFSNIDLDVAMKDNGGSSLLGEVCYLFYKLVYTGQGSSAEVAGTIEVLEEYRDWEEYKKTITDLKIPLEVHREQHAYFYEEIERTFYKELKIYDAIFKGDQAVYEESVIDGLLAHKTYNSQVIWNKINQEEDDRSLMASGWWSLSYTVACAFAYDRGMKLKNLESDYIPSWMVSGDFSQFKLMLED